MEILWSPLYTTFYGTLLHLTTDAYTITILHRLIIIFTVTLLILALLRRLLPPGLAWLMSAWWAINPNNFNVLYEIHLFALLPIIVAAWLAACKPVTWARGVSVAILVVASVLVRNELILAALLLACCCLGWEIWRVKVGGQSARCPRVYVFSYGLPLLLAGLLIIFFYTRSISQFPSLADQMKFKETFGLCQLYAFGYKERHPEWNKNPWLWCEDLMTTQFGQPEIPLGQAMQSNPSAMGEHFLWNARLFLPSLQVGLFGATSGPINPKYNPVPLESSVILLLSVAAGGILLIGLFRLYREWDYWWTQYLKERSWGWLSLLSVAIAHLIAGFVLRPNPEYTYGLTLLVVAMIGVSLWVITRPWSLFKQGAGFMPVVIVLILLVAPGYYYQSSSHIRPRQLLETYRRLAPFESILAQSDTVLLSPDGYYICNYLGQGRCRAVDYTILPKKPANVPASVFLANTGITLAYVDNNLLSTLQRESPEFIDQLSAELKAAGWQVLTFQDKVGERWMLITRR